MFSHLLKFEFKYLTRQPSFFVTFLLFFFLSFLSITIEQVNVSFGVNVMKNAPFAIAATMLAFSTVYIFVVVNFVGNAAISDVEKGMVELVATKPVQPVVYHLGRFFGSYLVCVVTFLSVPLGLFIGSLMPWVSEEVLTQNQWMAYLAPLVLFIVPTLLFFATLFYAVAQKAKSMLMVYLSAIVIYIIYSVSGAVFDEPSQRFYRSLFDPFALNTFFDYTRYWSAFERNNRLIDFGSQIWMNRGLWLLLGVSILFVVMRACSLYQPAKSETKSKKSTAETEKKAHIHPASISNQGSGSAFLAQWRACTSFEVKRILFGVPFLLLLLIVIVNTVFILFNINGAYGQPLWLVTQNIIPALEGGFGLLFIIVIVYFTAEVVWRENSVGIADIVDVKPVHNAVFWSAKLLAVCVVIFVLLIAAALLGAIMQITLGSTTIEWGQYTMRLGFFTAVPIIFMIVLAFLFHSISPSKYIGMGLFVVFMILRGQLDSIGLSHSMFNYGASPELVYTDINAYGDFIKTELWYQLYWGALAIIFALISFTLWRRGTHTSLRARVALSRYQLGGKGLVLMGFAALMFVGSGYVIYHNTTVVNRFISEEETLDLQAEYERKYVQYAQDNNPIITQVALTADVFPEQRRIQASAQIRVKNKGHTPIKRFLVRWPFYAKSSDLQIDGGKIISHDTKFDTAWFEFDTPLQVGESRQGLMSSVIDHDGFKDRDEDYTIVQNGTFINNFELFPRIGYQKAFEIGSKRERSKRGLPEPKVAHSLSDTQYHSENAFGRAVDFIDFSATVSTAAGQTIITPGYLTRQWEQDGRAYFHYEMDAPMVHFYNINSGQFAVQKEAYKGVDFEVYYHPAHHWNVEELINSGKDGLDYLQNAFSPYQHRQYRVIEFPGYRSFAQSFANTIPTTETFMLSDQRDESKLNLVYFVNAHEFAHQWWGHQLGAANVEGASVLSESLAQYSALMMMEKKFGQNKIREFLTYELDRYLAGRGQEPLVERPLLTTANQPYIHYKKGGLVMMALRYEMGEQRVNDALKNFLAEFQYQSQPYPTTLDLVRHLKVNASVSEQDIIDRLFNEVSIYDLSAKHAKIEETEEGKFKITLLAQAKKILADAEGRETEQEMAEDVEVVLFSDDPNNYQIDNTVLYQQKHRIKSGDNTIEIVVDEKPSYIGVDPFVHFLDRDSDNNILKL